MVELLALEREVTEDDPEGHVLTHRRADRDALISSLTAGRSPEWHRLLIASAEGRGWKRRRWRTLLTSEYLADLRAQVAVEEKKKTRAPAAPAEPWVLPPRRPPVRNP